MYPKTIDLTTGTAVWTYAIGDLDRFAWTCRLYIDSLRRLAKYSGHIAVFRPAGAGPDPLIDAAYDVEEIRIPIQPRRRLGCQCWKMEVADHYDFSRFEKVFGGDCDALALRSLAPLFALGGQINATESDLPMTERRKFGALLSPGERELAEATGRRGINSGHTVMPGPMVGEICATWRRRHREGMAALARGGGRRVHDQHAFCRMILLGDYEFVPFPAPVATVARLLKRMDGYSLDDPPPETALLHYCGAQQWPERIREMYLRRLGVME